MKLLRRACGALTLLAVSLAAGPSTRPTTASTTRTCTLAAARLRFDYPEDWSVASTPLPRQLFSAHTPPLDGQGRFAVVGLQLDRAAPGVDDRAATADLADALAAYAFNHGGQHVTIHPDALGIDALPARRVCFFTPGAAGAAGGTVGTLYVVAAVDGTQYLITVAGPAEIFDDAIADVGPMLHSFQRLQ